MNTKIGIGYPKFILTGLLFMSCCCGLTFAASGDDEQPGKVGMSRDMSQAVRLYRENRYNDAMDKFLDILVTGTPSEKAIANDYINRINQRFGAVDDSSMDTPPEDRIAYPGTPSRMTPSDSTDKRADSRDYYADSPDSSNDRLVGNVQQERRAVMAQRIGRKISDIRKLALIRLNKIRGVQVFMNGELPEAVSIDPDVIFTKEMNFRPDVDVILGDLSTVMYTLGKANFLILPEGIYAGDTKIVDMRRAMSVNSYFTRKGISTARMSVNLNITSHELPAKFKNIPGIGILFYYDKPIVTVNAAQADSDNPPLITVGVSAESFDPAKNDGTIIEFSVMQTGAKISFWKFQLLYYDAQRRLHVVQDATGDDSAYHQVFWNGREDFFGESYPAGKYIAVVAAADVVGRERIVRRPITIIGAARAASAAKKSAGTTVGGKKISSGARAARSIDREKPQRRKPQGARQAEDSGGDGEDALEDAAEPASEDTAAAGGEGAETAADDADETEEGADSQVKYTIAFRPGSAELSSNGGAAVRQVADSVAAYPMARVILTGTASDKEPDAQNMASSRAKKVAEMLTSKYGVDSASVAVKTRVSAESRAVVEVRMVSGE